MPLVLCQHGIVLLLLLIFVNLIGCQNGFNDILKIFISPYSIDCKLEIVQ